MTDVLTLSHVSGGTLDLVLSTIVTAVLAAASYGVTAPMPSASLVTAGKGWEKAKSKVVASPSLLSECGRAWALCQLMSFFDEIVIGTL